MKGFEEEGWRFERERKRNGERERGGEGGAKEGR